MTPKTFSRLLLGLLAIQLSFNARVHAEPVITPAEEDYAWWRDAKFGVFIHWNTSSLLKLGSGSWDRLNPHRTKAANYTDYENIPAAITDASYLEWTGKKRVPTEIYDNLFHIFNPTEFDADAWVKTFADAGAGYIIFVAKHHDGFCMFETAHSDYNIMNTPFGRDIAKEISEACERQGLKVLWYYSPADWWDTRHNEDDPAEYEDVFVNHLKELAAYPATKGFWFDGLEIDLDDDRILQTIHDSIDKPIYNGRGPQSETIQGYRYKSPEQRMGEFSRYPWETCQIIHGEGWFYQGGKSIKSTKTCLRLLIDSAVRDGNLLLNFGPTEKGEIIDPIQDIFAKMGDWMDLHGESIIKTRGGPYLPGHWGGSTFRDDTIY